MKITHRVVLATILPFLLVLAIVVVLFQQRIVAEQESLLRDDAQVRSLLSERFRDEREALSTAGRIMSGSVETARAVESRDIDVLRQWAPLFLSTSVSKVIFVDADGSVLFRTNDPFRFGDSALDWTPVAPALAGEDRQGFYRIDGAVVLADVRPVLRYGEIPVGAVITAIALDEAFLRNLVQRTDVALRLTVDGETSRSEGLDREVRQEVTMPLRSSEGSLTGQATVTFYRSDEIEALSRLRTRLLVLVGAMLLVVASILAWTINRYLVPYTVLVSELLDVARGHTSREEVTRRFSRVFVDPHHEVTVIASTVADYLVTIDRNMAELERLSTTDQLTGLYNRRSMEETLAMELNRAERYDEAGAVLLADIDHFKAINDNLGHPEGDQVLREAARLLTGTVRSTDIVARWGGEEFLILLPRVDHTGARATADKLRAAFADALLVSDPPAGVEPVGTISIGVAPYGAGSTADTVIHEADANLYLAKQQGRNRVVGREDLPDTSGTG
jgi:diguanylate cyclase (GGDEF)-like protein